MNRRFDGVLRGLLRATRWALAPFCLGLILALLIVLAQFCRELGHTIGRFAGMDGREIIISVLRLIDLVFIANLVVMLIGAGVALLLPELPAGERPSPQFSGVVGFAGIKLRVFAAISTIAAIDLLESFINIASVDKSAVPWEIAILLGFVVAGLLLALMERLSDEQR